MIITKNIFRVRLMISQKKTFPKIISVFIRATATYNRQRIQKQNCFRKPFDPASLFNNDLSQFWNKHFWNVLTAEETERNSCVPGDQINCPFLARTLFRLYQQKDSSPKDISFFSDNKSFIHSCSQSYVTLSTM